VPGSLRHCIAAALLLAGFSPAGAQTIYSCVDAKGRRLTADRPIAECMDREQRVMSPSGTVLRSMPPSLTAEERAAQEEKARKAAEERARLEEEKRRDRALLTRFPDKVAHDKERAIALATADGVTATAVKRAAELAAQRQRLATELEFYSSDPSKVPPRLKHQVEETDREIEAQKRFLANQETEKRQIDVRYDEELVRLRKLWLPATATR
jgi:hypothetical protein